MARPFLADAEFVSKARDNRAAEIAPCIACNQACLDHTFSMKLTSCLVNPRACAETELNYLPAENPKTVAVVGAGPAGMSTAIIAANRGHIVTLFDAASELGGQLNMAKQVPGKEEFFGLVDYYAHQIELSEIDLRLNTRASATDLVDYDEVIIATGVLPRMPDINGIDHPSVLSYVDVLRDKVDVGSSVALIGAGGIGFDVAEFLAHSGESPAINTALWRKEWGVDDPSDSTGGIAASGPQPHASAREIHLLQRKATKLGKGLGKTTGWIHRATLKMKGVHMIGGVNYEQITDAGLHISFGDERKDAKTLTVDNIVICAGQTSQRSLADELKVLGKSHHVIGGADVAAELDAKRAINQGSNLAAEI
jgi:2,4-dienoyl-CoA reductase (NADPH2)